MALTRIETDLIADSSITADKIASSAVTQTKIDPSVELGGGLDVIVDKFTGNGSTTQYSLSQIPTDEDKTIVIIEGVAQLKSSYSISGNVVTFSTAVPNNYNFEVVIFVGAVGTASANSSLDNLTSVAINTSLLPATTLTVDLGSSTKRWRDLYLSGNTISLGDATISATGSVLNLPAGTTVGGTAVTSGIQSVASRPGSPTAGTIIWNTTTNSLEVWVGLNWATLALGPFEFEVFAWGGGGAGGTAGGWTYGAPGGAGGAATGRIGATSGIVYSVVIGGGGLINPTTGALGGGGAMPNNTDNRYGGGGGGYSGIFLGTSISQANARIIAGGGGGGGSSRAGTGNAGGGGGGLDGEQGYSPYDSKPQYGGGGGTQSAGGAGAPGNNGAATSGSALQGGNAAPNAYGGGGGGGYFGGGGGGYSESNTMGGGGGGSGYLHNSVISGVLTAAVGNIVGNNSNALRGSYGNAGAVGGAGTQGVLIIRYLGDQRAVGGTVTSSGGYIYHTFTAAGTFTTS